MLRYLPHEVGDLEPVLGLAEAAATGLPFADARAVTLLWLLILAKMPFQVPLALPGLISRAQGSRVVS